MVNLFEYVNNIVSEADVSKFVYITHVTEVPTVSVLRCVYSQIVELTYGKFVERLKRDVLLSFLLAKLNVTEREYIGVINKLKTDTVEFKDREQDIIDAILKVLNASTTVDELVKDSDRGRAKGIFFYISEDNMKYKELKVAPYKVEFRLYENNLKRVASNFKFGLDYIIYDHDLLSGPSKMLSFNDLFKHYNDVFRDRKHPLELMMKKYYLNLLNFRKIIG